MGYSTVSGNSQTSWSQQIWCGNRYDPAAWCLWCGHELEATFEMAEICNICQRDEKQWVYLTSAKRYNPWHEVYTTNSGTNSISWNSSTTLDTKDWTSNRW